MTGGARAQVREGICSAGRKVDRALSQHARMVAKQDRLPNETTAACAARSERLEVARTLART